MTHLRIEDNLVVSNPNLPTIILLTEVSMKQKEECQEPGCTMRAASRGLCRNHYAIWYYNQKKVTHEGMKKEPSLQIPRLTCRIMGCDQQELNNFLCKDHYDLILGHSFDYVDQS